MTPPTLLVDVENAARYLAEALSEETIAYEEYSLAGDTLRHAETKTQDARDALRRATNKLVDAQTINSKDPHD